MYRYVKYRTSSAKMTRLQFEYLFDFNINLENNYGTEDMQGFKNFI